MENKHLIDLTIKYGLSGSDLAKVVALVHQAGYGEPASPEFQRIADHICESGLIDKPAEEVLEDLKLKGLVVE